MIGGACVGVLVGAGFASGQDLLVFFVYFGAWGVVGTLLSAALFTFLGMALAWFAQKVWIAPKLAGWAGRRW